MPLVGAGTWKFYKTLLTNLYTYVQLTMHVLKGNSMGRHHMGPNQMHPDISSCLNLTVNDSIGPVEDSRLAATKIH